VTWNAFSIGWRTWMSELSVCRIEATQRVVRWGTKFGNGDGLLQARRVVVPGPMAFSKLVSGQ
jgi:hypothetical protein